MIRRSSVRPCRRVRARLRLRLRDRDRDNQNVSDARRDRAHRRHVVTAATRRLSVRAQDLAYTASSVALIASSLGPTNADSIRSRKLRCKVHRATWLTKIQPVTYGIWRRRWRDTRTVTLVVPHITFYLPQDLHPLTLPMTRPGPG
jgi:hypothetical protein